MGERVAILGASQKADRYSYKALKMLEAHGHQPLPVHPLLDEIEGYKVFANLDALPRAIDTLTLYVNPSVGNEQKEAILRLKPRRVIFNPGTENPALEQSLEAAGIRCQQACTLVLLTTNQFDN